MDEKRSKEIEFLNKLKDYFQAAKQELNNDLTKLAIKNLPILSEDETVNQQTQEILEGDNVPLAIGANLQLNQEGGLQSDVQELVPLDLDI